MKIAEDGGVLLKLKTPYSDGTTHLKLDLCDYCGTKMVLVACITSHFSCRRTLEHLKMETKKVVATSPRGPPEEDYFDQSLSDF